MELIKKNIHMEHHLNLASTQISMEEDQNISDQKPDASQIICKKSFVKIEDVKTQENTVTIKGKFCYHLLYLTDEKEKRLCNMDGEIPFEEKVYIDRGETYDNLRVVTCVEDLMIRLINSRKVNIRCVMTVSIIRDELYEEEVVVDTAESDSCEILKKSLDVTSIVLDTKDIYRIKEEVTIPDGFPNIYRMLWKNIRLSGLNFIPMDGKIGIQGEWTAFFMYEGEDEELVPRFFEISRPFSGLLEVPDCKENMILCIEHEIEEPQIEVRGDYDGEDRLIGMDLEMKLYIKLYRNKEIEVVADAYGLKETLEPVMRKTCWEQLFKKETGKIKLNDLWEDKENSEKMLQVLSADGCIVDDKVVILNEEVKLTGVVHLEILCLTEENEAGYQCISTDIPYQQVISVPGIMSDATYHKTVTIDQLMVHASGNKIEIRMSLDYQLCVYRKMIAEILMGLEIDKKNDQEEQLPVMAIYFAKKEDTIWDVGKKYRVSLKTIRENNQLKSDILAQGQKLLVAKEMI